MAKKITGDVKESQIQGEPQENSDLIKKLENVISELKDRNITLEGKNTLLSSQLSQEKNKPPVEKIVEKVIEKIVEVPVEKIVEKVIEKIVEVPVSYSIVGDVWDYKYKLGSKVYFPEKYQRLNFEVRELMGAYKGVPLYRIYNNSNLIEEQFVYEDKLFLL